MAYNRYSKFTDNGAIKRVPFIPIPNKVTDKYTTYYAGRTRLDMLSYQYYDDPNFGWLILQANPQYGSLEFNIPNRATLRIPYPLESTITQYNSDIDRYATLYGLDY